MKTETLLNAMERADFERLWEEPQSARIRRRRQYRTFRAAILDRDEDLRDAVEAQKWVIDSQKRRIAELEARIEALGRTP